MHPTTCSTCSSTNSPRWYVWSNRMEYSGSLPMSSAKCCIAKNAAPKLGLQCSSRFATAARTRPNSCVRTPCRVIDLAMLGVQQATMNISKLHNSGRKSISTATDLPPPAETPAAEEVHEEPQLAESLELLCFPPPVHQQHAACRLPSCHAHNTVCCHDEVLRRVCILRLDDNKVVWPPCSDVCSPA